LGTTLTNQKWMLEEINSRLNLGNACTSKNIMTKICKTITSPGAVYRCETWSLTRKKQHRLVVFGNKVLRKIFGPTIEEVTGD
jgi:hypothetical protein